MKVYLDGKYVDAADAKISVFDHGLLYGDGVFEGIRLYQGNVFRLEEHLERLWFSAKAVMLTIPISRAEMAAAVCDSCRQNGLRDGYIRLVVTRGPGDLGLAPWLCPKPCVIIIADKIALYPPELYATGLTLATVATRRVGAESVPPGIKSLNYLNNILAKLEARQAGAQEAVMLNPQGFVAECTADNLFIVRQGRIYTPAVQQGGLRGITRDTIFDTAQSLAVPIEEHDLTRYDLWTADECFITGTGAEVIAAVKVDGREVGNGKPGPITNRVLAEFRKRVLVEGTRI